MKTAQNRTWDFLPNVEANFGGGVICKRAAYKPAYCLLIFAYLPAYCPAYLYAIGKAGRGSVTLLRLVLWVEKIIYYKPSCSFSQN